MERQCVLFLHHSSLLTIRQFARHSLTDSDICGSDCHGTLFRSFPSATYVHAVVWGQVPRYRLIIAISPLAIMIATINIVLASLYRARHLNRDYIASFNAMNTLHIIAACSSGNVHTVSFPDYGEDIGLFGKDVQVELSGAAGFHFSPS